MKNQICFVIQPFSEKYDERYEDIYKPAIENETGIAAYRVDKDPEVTNLIEAIEQHIKESVICFADISEDNPNVWYELGYARALNKKVVIICDESKRSSLPFDMAPLATIFYKSDSPRGFEKLSKNITEKTKALFNKNIPIIKDNVAIQPVKSLSTEHFFQSEVNYKAALMGCYQSLRSYFEYVCVLDASVCNQIPTKTQIDPVSKEIDKAWNLAYKTVCHLDVLLDAKENTTFDSSSYLCVAKTLRTIVYLDLTQHWGNVPFLLKASKSDPFISAHSTHKNEIWDALLNDLNEILSKVNQSDIIRDGIIVSSSFIKYLMAIINLEKNNFLIAANLLKEVIDSNKYQVVLNLAIPTEVGEDTLFSLLYTTGENSFYTPFSQIKKGNRHPLYRYAGLLLNYAEALYKLEDKEKALSIVNALRKHLGLEMLSHTEGVAHEIAILWNRIIGMDYGYYALLKRLDLLSSVLNIDKRYALFPIPQKELISNPQIVQNPWY
ncbi:MAG: RagB/SusD family nutrient uptake outer membrane protein [Bacteroides sp.]|jgi:tetratricopeptide (TPR) repeat protein|nr:RagB/SusD family nutrient uptake outer membrane protein [Bacteroides sp.]